MRIKIIFGIMVLLFALNFASAATDTEVTINTIPYYDLMVRFLSPGTTTIVGEGSIYATSNATGIATFTFSSGIDQFEVKVWLKKDGETVLIKEFEETYNAGGNLNLDIYPEWYEIPKKEEVVNESETIVQNITEEVKNTTEEINSTEKQEKVTALVSGGIIKSKTSRYIGLGILVILIGFFVIKKIKSKKPKKEIKVKKLSEIQDDKENRIKEQEERIENAQKELEEAKKAINNIKNENKIAEVKKKLIEDEKELMRLRRGEE